MKINIIKDVLKEGVFFTNKIVQKTISLPILQTTLLEAKKNLLILKNTNLETAIEWEGLANVEKEGKICVNTKTLSQIVNHFPSKKISLSVENNNLVVEGEKTKVKIPGVDPQEFPIIPEISRENQIILPKKELFYSLSSLVKIPTLSSARPEISGILFSFQKGELKLVATDSFRLSERTILNNFNVENLKLILPQTAVKELISILEKSEKEVKLYQTPSQVWFEFNLPEILESKVIYTSRLIEGEYPKYENVIPKKFSLRVFTEKEELIENLKAASIFSGRNNEIKFKISSTKNTFLILSSSPESGEYSGEIKTRMEGKADLEICFNYRFLFDGILEIEEPEIELSFTNEEGAAMIKPLEKQDYIYILMPIKNV